MQRPQEPDDFDVFGLWTPRIGIKRMRALMHEAQATNKLPETKPIFLENFRLTFKQDLQGACDYLLTDVTTVLKIQPVPYRVRLLLFYCHFLPYLALAVFPLILSIQLFSIS